MFVSNFAVFIATKFTFNEFSISDAIRSDTQFDSLVQSTGQLRLTAVDQHESTERPSKPTLGLYNKHSEPTIKHSKSFVKG